MSHTIAIIGGGAAGLAAAVSARKENKKAEITVYERNDRVAKKIHATGNGRCNFTNAVISEDCFFGDREFIEHILSDFGTAEAVDFFYSLGIMHREEEGRIYPLSNRASAVADALRLFLEENNVNIVTEQKITEIKKCRGGFLVGNDKADCIIVASGGAAAPTFGTDGAGYSLLSDFGHSLKEPRAALVSLKTDVAKIRGLKGVKAFAKVRIGTHSDVGELLFTDYGVSGIPVMQLSGFAIKGDKILIDMLPDMSFKETVDEIMRLKKAFPKREVGELFSGLVNKKLAAPMLREAGIDKISVKAETFTEQNARKAAEFLKKLELKILGNSGFENAQVTRGGISLDKFDANTMESKLQKGLYAAGEILDCDGICGGYNLHWAWATGIKAGKSAAKEA